MTGRPLVTRGLVASRLRMPLLAASAATLLAVQFVDVPGPLVLAPPILFAVAMAFYFRLGRPQADTVDLTAPVRGRWLAVNSPSTRVPSHGVHAWSQTYAIDLVAEPAEQTGQHRPPAARWWPISRQPSDYPAFGEPVHAPVDGTVVRRVDAMRDHRTRTSLPAMLYFFAESVRELLGPVGVLGNHLVIRRDDGICVLLAHLRRRSIRVVRGQRVVAGDVVARCGNSGNSTEPHLHLQAMDRPSVWIAAGMPMRVDGEPVPANGDHLVVPDADTGTGTGTGTHRSATSQG
jgi:hypothetical protein